MIISKASNLKLAPIEIDSLSEEEFFRKLGFKRPKKNAQMQFQLQKSEKTFSYDNKLGLFLLKTNQSITEL